MGPQLAVSGYRLQMSLVAKRVQINKGDYRGEL